MWYIIWCIKNRPKPDRFFFTSKEQAFKYAEYYKELFNKHAKGQYLKRRFSNCPFFHQKEIRISYTVKEK